MAFDMHLKFVKGSGTIEIEGSSLHEGHEKEIEILAWSWGVSNYFDLHSGTAAGSGGKANVRDISITKYIDKSSNSLLKACVGNKQCDEAYIYITNNKENYLTIKLSEGVRVASTSTGGSGGEERLTENISLHFGAYEYTFQPRNKNGEKDGAPVNTIHNIKTNTVS